MNRHSILCLAIFSALFSHSLFASQMDLPGAIPLRYEMRAATDLTYQGRPILPEEAHRLHEQGVDLSKLEPEASDIWKPLSYPLDFTNNPHAQIQTLDDLGVQQMGETFQFVSIQPTLIGYMRILVKKTEPNGVDRFFTIMLGRKIHNALLRKGLLRKLGYHVPAIQYLKTFKIRFDGPFSRDYFVNENMPQNLDAFPDLWVTNVKRVVESEGARDKDNDSEQAQDRAQWEVKDDDGLNNSLNFQDAIIFRSDEYTYNFAALYVDAPTILNRRVFNALLVPMGLTFVPESVNMFDWELGQIVNDRLYLNYEFRHEFSPTYEDAKWIARKILSLSRQDFFEIVKEAELPVAVSKLIVEKLISRRNFLIKYFNLGHEFKNLNFDPKVSYKGENGNWELKEGVLVREEWPGYATVFNFKDPQSPLSNSEVFAFAKSKVIANAISNVVDEINRDWLPRTDVVSKLKKKYLDMAVNQLIESVETGKPVDVPLGFFAVPVGGVNLIASREIVAGRYLGTENRVQMAHTLGFSLQGGLFISGYGLPSGFSLSGKTEAVYTQTYTHLQPVTSMRKALEQPFKNILVPLVAGEMGQTLNEVAQGEFNDLDTLKGEDYNEKKDRLLKLIETFNDHFEVGESLIIAQNIGNATNFTLGYGLAERLALQADFNSSLITISRLHILRKDKKTIQIYDDFGTTVTLGLSLGLNASGVRTVGIHLQWMPAGHGKSRYYNLNIDTRTDANGRLANADLIKNLSIVRSTLANASPKMAKAHYEPIEITSSFDQFGLGMNFLFFQYKYLSTDQSITIKKDQHSAEYVRRAWGERSGENYENLTLDILTSLVSEFTDNDDLNFRSTNSGDPGDTFKGRSVIRQIEFQAREFSEGRPIEDAFVNINYRWKGWEASQKKLKKILDEINNKFALDPLVSEGTPSVPPFHLERINDTAYIQLYSITADVFVYQRGIERLAQLPKEKVLEYFKKYARFPQIRTSRDNSDRLQKQKNDAIINGFLRAQDKYQKWSKKGEAGKAAGYALQFLNAAESLFPFHIFVEMVGGSENLFVQARVEGFREGSDSGDEPLISNSIGEFGSRQIAGPLRYLQGELEMSEGELLFYWLLERL